VSVREHLESSESFVLVLPGEEGPMFVSVVTPGDSLAMVGKPRESRLIRIEIAGAVVHAERGVDPDFLTEVLRAVKTAA
jgi:hypothetical protein